MMTETVFTRDMINACQQPGCERTDTDRVIVNEKDSFKLFCPKHQHARVVEHHYAHGVRFHIVECQTCLSVLNSGHHYLDRDLVHAINLAARHNGTVHRTSL